MTSNSSSVFSLHPVFESVFGIIQSGNTTWNSSWLQLTDSLRGHEVMAGHCALLLMTSPLYAYFLLGSHDKPLPEGRLYKCKMVCCMLLALMPIPEVVFHVGYLQSIVHVLDQPVLVSSASTLLTAVVSSQLTRLAQQRGMRWSAVLCLLWLSLILTHTLAFLTSTQESDTGQFPTWLFYLKSSVITCLLVLYGFSEREEQYFPPGVRKPCPEPTASWWSRLTFSWTKELLDKAYSGKLTEKDIFLLLPSDSSSNVVPRFTRAWAREVTKSKFRNQAQIHDEVPAATEAETLPEIPSPSPWEQAETKPRRRTRSEGRAKHKILYERSQSAIHPRTESHKILGSDHSPVEKAYSRSVGQKDTKESRAKTGQKRSRPSLLVVLVRTFGVDFAIGQLYRLTNVALHMTDPLIFGYLLDFMEDSSAPSRKGYAICALMVISKMAQSFMNSRTHFVNHSFALRIKSAVINSIYNKVLTMDTESRQESTVGQAVNLISVDASDIREALTNMASEMWTSPAKIVLSLVLLYRLLGPSMLISMLLMVIMVPVTAVVTRRLTTMHRDSMAFKDNRLKMLTEVVNGIKILKMYAWEPSFISKLNAARGKELDVMWWRSFWETALHCYHQVMPYMISVVMFVTYVHSSEDHYLTPSTAFVAIALMDILRSAMEELPSIITHMVKVRVSFRRVNDFLNRTDLEDNVSSDVDSDAAISIEDGFFSWTSEATPTLKNINVRVKKGSLVAVVGTVGCGKSSLLSACLGEMNTLRGHVSVKGSVAYVPQQAWIQHASLRDNVLFGGHVDEKLYNQCLDNCALRTDLEIMPGGDNTEIGERGINLSGGQKQRVSLARAVYSQADVYIMDDPLSAVDCHVGSHIFDNVIGHQGMLAGKTRVLVTHGVQWLPKVDQIIVVRHGRVSEVGSYDELLSHNGPFAKFLKHYMVHDSETKVDPQGKVAFASAKTAFEE
ncbi:hypothetical protein V1264_020017 [Littorina saxatilis]|uniref:Uncharacterized protein n=1 Tax=Littorina saxatilis TaxID=31220 RepID=A0AAN9GCB5_9CAEN